MKKSSTTKARKAGKGFPKGADLLNDTQRHLDYLNSSGGFNSDDDATFDDTFSAPAEGSTPLSSNKKAQRRVVAVTSFSPKSETTKLNDNHCRIVFNSKCSDGKWRDVVCGRSAEDCGMHARHRLANEYRAPRGFYTTVASSVGRTNGLVADGVILFSGEFTSDEETDEGTEDFIWGLVNEFDNRILIEDWSDYERYAAEDYECKEQWLNDNDGQDSAGA